MSHRNMLWAGHIFVLILLGEGLRWTAGNIRGLSEYSLLLGFAAMTALVLNHFRWWAMSKAIDQTAVLVKIDALVIANYGILILVLVLAHLCYRHPGLS